MQNYGQKSPLNDVARGFSLFFFFPKRKTARKGRLGAVRARTCTNYRFTSDELATATGDRLAAMLYDIADTAVRKNLHRLSYSEYDDARQNAVMWMLKYSVPKLVVGSNAISYCYFAAAQSIKRFCKIRERSRHNDSEGGADHFHDREALNDEEPEF